MKESSVLHRKIAPALLAKMHLSRQKAKSILTILSLPLGGVLAVLISTMLVFYEGLIYSVFATLVTLILGTGFGFLSSCENDESILLLFISAADRIDIFSDPADCAVYLDFLHNWKSEKAISC